MQVCFLVLGAFLYEPVGWKESRALAIVEALTLGLSSVHSKGSGFIRNL